MLAFCLTAAVIYFLPYCVDLKYVVANAVGDDSIYAYRVISQHPERFQNDLMQYVWRGHVASTLLNYGSLWLIATLHVPIELIHLSFVCVQIFAFPVIFLALVWKHMSSSERPLVFLLSFLAGFVYWNPANFGEIPVPYAANIALPILWLGLWYRSKEKLIGYGLLVLGSLFHPVLGLHCLALAVMSLALDWRAFRIKKLALLGIPLVCALAQPLIIMSGDFPHVTKAELMRVLELNMHATPWDAVFRWWKAFPTVMALLVFAGVSYPGWGRLGERYKKLIVSAFITAIVLSASQVVGHLFEIPKLIQVMGLRSCVLFVMFLFPILILFLKDALLSGNSFVRLCAAFVVLQIVLARPYGLDKMPILFLGLIGILAHRERVLKLNTELVRRAVYVLGVSWFGVWLFFKIPRPGLFDLEVLKSTWTFLDYVSLNWLVDFGPDLSMAKRAILLVSALLVACWPFLNRVSIARFRRVPVISPVVIAIGLISLTLCFLSLGQHREFSNQRNRDLYDAQIWARDNTDPDDHFMFTYGNWRSFSERSLFPLLPQRYYYYFPDQRVKKFDDFMIRVLHLEEAFKNNTQKEWYFSTWLAYGAVMKEPQSFQIVSKMTGANYLIENRKLDLPIAYRNENFTIYKVR